MKTTIVFTLIAGITILSCDQPVKPVPDAEPIAVKDSAQLVEHGKYLVTIAGCNDCHTPKRMGAKGPELIPELLLSGYSAAMPLAQFDEERARKGFAQMNEDMTAAAGPWGISFAANLTPHETGIRNWTFENFKLSMTQGKAKGLQDGRVLLPPMPWFNYAEMKDEDLRAIYEYLKTLKPVDNIVPAPKMWK